MTAAPPRRNTPPAKPGARAESSSFFFLMARRCSLMADTAALVSPKAEWLSSESSSRFSLLVGHDFSQKPLNTFRDLLLHPHALLAHQPLCVIHRLGSRIGQRPHHALDIPRRHRREPFADALAALEEFALQGNLPE